MLKQQLQQKLQQKLSPQQIQVIRLLELTTAEFEERVKQELVENPALEEGPSQSDEKDPSRENNTPENESEGNNDSEDLSLGDYYSEDDIPEYKLEEQRARAERREEIPFSGGSTFHDYLLKQLGERQLSEEQYKIAEYIVGNIDDDGYLRRDLNDISNDIVFQTSIEVSPDKLESFLKIIQEFDPPGVGARNLQECLTIQLKHRPANTQTILADKIIQNYFEDFSKKHYDKIIRQLEITPEELKSAIQEIMTLNPKPGNQWEDEGHNSNIPIIPDFTVETQDGELYLSLNSGNIPQLKVSRNYTEMLEDYNRNAANQTREKRDALLFVKQKIESAQWFIDAIQQRQQTLLKTMQAIVELQREFFLTGDEMTLKPMILKDLAQKAGLDVSTVSRVSNSKYVQTNFGIFPLKFFFGELVQNSSGKEFSVREIKAMLQSFIDGEDKKNPLADDRLCELMQEQGVSIARRTVAKYREQLGYPVARLRKEI